MNRSELERLLAGGESDRVELTISVTDIDKFGEAICSFANDMPNARDLNRLALEIAEERPIPRADLSEAAVFDYPPKAMREILMNAVIHRNYDDSTTPILINHYSGRIELQNPGGLYGDLSPEQFPNGTAYRNPILAEAAKVLGFVNRFGRGIQVVQRELQRNGSPPARFDPSPTFFLATVGRRP